jgi:hypothetical protein
VVASIVVGAAAVVLASEKYTQLLTGRARMAVQIEQTGRTAMSKAQKGNKEKRKPKADKNQPKTHVSAYKAAQGQGKPSFNPFARKT